MREKIKVSDLTTLHVCPSSNWGTLERRAIADSVFFRDFGGNSIIFCLKNSYIDYEAKLQDIPTIYYTGKKVNKFLDLSYLMDIRNILKENRFDIIHCYDLNYIWNISLMLLANPKIPLFLSFNNFLDKSYKGFLEKWLFKRVDKVLTYSNATKEIALELLPINIRKIITTGAGVELSKSREINQASERVIGSFVNKGGDLFRKVRPILYAVLPLYEAVKKNNFDIRFIFFSEDNWQELEQIEKINQTINDLGINEWVSFETVHKREIAIQKLDIFIGTEFDEPFNDFEVMALMSSIPVVIPRTASRQELLSKKMFIGESYQRSDSRELKYKLLKILENEKVYLSELSENNEAISNTHGVEFYWERLIGLYEGSYIKRLRVSNKIDQGQSKSIK